MFAERNSEFASRYSSDRTILYSIATVDPKNNIYQLVASFNGTSYATRQWFHDKESAREALDQLAHSGYGKSFFKLSKKWDLFICEGCF